MPTDEHLRDAFESPADFKSKLFTPEKPSLPSNTMSSYIVEECGEADSHIIDSSGSSNDGGSGTSSASRRDALSAKLPVEPVSAPTPLQTPLVMSHDAGLIHLTPVGKTIVSLYCSL